MNENVTNTTPKRRRWIARLLVSALCILLASSLLFVGVVADTITLSAQYSGNIGIQSDTYQYCPIDESHFAYVYSNYLYIQSGSSVIRYYDLKTSPGFQSSYSNYFVGALRYSSGRFCYATYSQKGSRNPYLTLYFVDVDSNFDIISSSVVYQPIYISLVGIGDELARMPSIYFDGSNVYGLCHLLWNYPYDSYYVPFSYVDDQFLILKDYYFGGWDGYDPQYPKFFSNNCVYFNNYLFVSGLASSYRISLVADSQVALSFGGETSFFVYQDELYAIPANSSSLYKFDSSLNDFAEVGVSPSASSFLYVPFGAILYGYGTSSSSSVPYTIYTGLPTSTPPPESSDETTTESPPESSEESSEPDVTMTKILKYEPGSGGTSVSSVIGEVDLNDAVKVEAFLGRFESSPDNSNWTDSYQNLMLRVTNSDDTEDIYQFDFPAFGYYSGLLSSEVEFSDFVFPGFVGYWFEIPFENGSEISFATKSPGGSVFLYGYNMQLTVNFNSPDSSFRLLFGQDSYSVVLSNIGENSQTVVFEDETVLRYKKFTVNGGSSWYAPEEGTFALFPASDVLDPNVLLSSIRIETNVDNTLGFPTESFLESVSKWEEYLSRQEDKQDYLNSLAGDAYDQISIDPDTSEAYGDAVDTFSSIVNSEGGSVIFSFFRYMWSVHPLMSSMVSLVISFSIIGFIVRKV